MGPLLFVLSKCPILSNSQTSNPQNSIKMYKFTIAVAACIAAAAYAFDPLTLTVGGISYVATGAQVGVAIASLAALALAKEGLLLAEISRGRRDTNTVSSHKLDP